jgi:hypothetical protein
MKFKNTYILELRKLNALAVPRLDMLTRLSMEHKNTQYTVPGDAMLSRAISLCSNQKP